MKTIFFSLLFLAVTVNLAISQCNPYYVFSKTTEFENEHFNAKGKKTGRGIYKVKDFTPSGNGYKAIVTTELYDDKDKLQGEAKDMEISCNNGIVNIDLKGYIPQESMNAYKNMTVTYSGENLELPAKLTAGQTLKDGSMTADIKNESNTNFAQLNFKILNRKVEAEESITTPAGTFNSYKVSYDMQLVTDMMGIKIPTNLKAVEWYAEKVGIVKTETYNKNGKLIGYTQLKSYK